MEIHRKIISFVVFHGTLKEVPSKILITQKEMLSCLKKMHCNTEYEERETGTRLLSGSSLRELADSHVDGKQVILRVIKTDKALACCINQAERIFQEHPCGCDDNQRGEDVPPPSQYLKLKRTKRDEGETENEKAQK